MGDGDIGAGQPDVYELEQLLRSYIRTAASHHIPSGRIVQPTPHLPPAAASWMKERDALRATNPADPQLTILNNCIHKSIREAKTTKWREFLGTFDHRTDPGKLWKTIKALDGKATELKRNQPIKFKYSRRKKTCTAANDVSERFNRQYTAVKRHVTSGHFRTITKTIQKRSLADAPQFTPTQVKNVIRKAKNSKAAGPDGITMIHLKHLGPNALDLLTETFNASLRQSKIPQIWKTSIVIPLLKPGKPAEESSSYRPVSLLCPAVKVLEKCLLPILQEHLRSATHQHGFRPRHSTISALNELSTAISDGFNKPKPAARSILVALDLSKAFDTVCHATLLKLLNETGLPGAVVRWLSAYLHGRQAKTLFRDHTSKTRIVRFGVPQGSVISPTLFNFYVSDAPLPSAPILLVSYADDFTLLATGIDPEILAEELNGYLTTLCKFLDDRSLEISAPKCSVTLFTSWTAQHKVHPQVKIADRVLDLKKNPKVLGVIFDPSLTFGPNTKAQIVKARSRNNAIKALSGTTWGQSKETLVTTYQTLVKPLLEYAAPVWAPLLADTNFEHLQKVQNSALRTATGCTKMTDTDHLHTECKMLPIRRHTRMRSIQMQAAHHLEDHPGHHLLFTPRPPPKRNGRPPKQTLLLRYERYMPPLLEEDDEESDEDEEEEDMRSEEEIAFSCLEKSLDEDRYHKVIKAIHTNEVRDYIAKTQANKVLEGPAPAISEDEKDLPRNVRRTLAQLRSSYSPHLRSYLHRIGKAPSPLCPDCETEPQTTRHLFNCVEFPTQLTVEALWTNPVEAAFELELDVDPEEAANHDEEDVRPSA